jgi:formylglycine-generating enzyme required for sulfatase activity
LPGFCIPEKSLQYRGWGKKSRKEVARSYMRNSGYTFGTINFQGVIGAFVLFVMASIASAQSVVIALCHVGNAQNAPDPSTGFGKVDYEYSIGKFDVTEDQYVAFLNAVAKTDKYRLYSPMMAKAGNGGPSDEEYQTGAGIVRSGSSGNYSYSVIGNSGNDPITFVTWFNAARFCNWLHNGQPTDPKEAESSTETGAYPLNGDKTRGNETKTPGAKWWIPSENEWYKAAYYDPELNGGKGGYWRFATRSNSTPGNVIGSGSNQVNGIVNAAFSVKIKRYSHDSLLTPVGAFTNSASYYGTYDQAGNVAQWNDALVSGKRGIRGAPCSGFTFEMSSATHSYASPLTVGMYMGFRVATLPPQRGGESNLTK